MAFVGTDILAEFKNIAEQWILAAAQVSTVSTDRQEFGAATLAASGFIEENTNIYADGLPVFNFEDCEGARMVEAGRVLRGSVIAGIAEYLRQNDPTHAPQTNELGTVLRALITGMTYDSPAETIDASVPSIGSPVYMTSNQGNGTATLAVSSNATLKELLPAGEVILTCTNGTFQNQNEEQWQLSIQMVDPRTNRKTTRVSQSIGFVTGTEYKDIVYLSNGRIISASELGYDDVTLQVPQFGGNVHTGLTITVSAPSNYDDISEVSGDTNSVAASYSVQKKDGSKSNITRRNSTFQADDTSRKGDIWLHYLNSSGTIWDFTWRVGSATDSTALTETLQYDTASDPDGVKTWKAAATNPEHEDFGGFLTTSDNFISADITLSSLVASPIAIRISCPLPWATGDTIKATATNAYGGTLERVSIMEWGVALPATTSGETVTDP